jgi:hypothetical protein
VSRNARNAYVVNVGGPKIDVEPLLASSDDGDAEPGTPMIVDAAVGYARLGAGGGAEGVVAHLERDDRRWQTMTIDGGLASRPMAVRMRPDGNGRTFSVTAGDAGAVLKALDVTSNVRGGTLSLAGRYDDSDPASPFKGRIEIRNFHVDGAPLIAKVLSVASLTGIRNVLSGQGIDFSRFEATITFVDGAIYTDDLRSHGSALGFTGRGSVNLRQQTIDLQGTVVPAYSVNSVLGNIPVLGAILTGPEGGGVFAANYRMRGSLDDPAVSVNPLATLAPGILRNIFNIFDTPAKTAPPPTAPAPAAPAAPAPSAPAPTAPSPSTPPAAPPSTPAPSSPSAAPPSAPTAPAPSAPAPAAPSPATPPATPPSTPAPAPSPAPSATPPSTPAPAAPTPRAPAPSTPSSPSAPPPSASPGAPSSP